MARPFGTRNWSADQVHDDNWSEENIRPSYFKHCPRVQADMDCDACGYEGRSEDNPAVTHALFLSQNNARHAAADAISAAYFYPDDDYQPDYYNGDDGL